MALAETLAVEAASDIGVELEPTEPEEEVRLTVLAERLEAMEFVMSLADVSETVPDPPLPVTEAPRVKPPAVAVRVTLLPEMVPEEVRLLAAVKLKMESAAELLETLMEPRALR